jgi:hypothetical protein
MQGLIELTIKERKKLRITSRRLSYSLAVQWLFRSGKRIDQSQVNVMNGPATQLQQQGCSSTQPNGYVTENCAVVSGG